MADVEQLGTGCVVVDFTLCQEEYHLGYGLILGCWPRLKRMAGTNYCKMQGLDYICSPVCKNGNPGEVAQMVRAQDS